MFRKGLYGREGSMSHNNGSTLIAFDLDFDDESNLSLVFSPEALHAVLGEIISGAQMIAREHLLDVWDTLEHGPATSFRSLQESHIRVVPRYPHTPNGEFIRAETWTEDHPRAHANGEVQLCNYSRDNSEAAWQIVLAIIKISNPASASIMVIERGPGRPLRQAGTLVYKRAMPLPESTWWKEAA